MSAVAILGCGPAGLLCAAAVERAGHVPVIFSKKVKSEIPGSLHLRESIPGVTSPYPDNTAVIVRMGTPEGYAHKVYGDPARNTGWENYANVYPSWNAVGAYDRLWERYEDRIVPIVEITPRYIVTQMAEISDFGVSLIISTLPKPVTCLSDAHVFNSVPYFIKPLPLPECERGREIIIYNGRLDDIWYRYSVLGDKCAIESTMPMEGAIPGRKVTNNNCDCWNGVVFAGRWAEWRHGVLLQHAYQKAYNAAKELA